MVAAIAAVLLLILFTGYLIIYNVFQISVTNDIRFYGLLKTIGTTGRQLRRIIRYQALALSLAGIPVGLLLGWLVGAGLTPAVIGRLNGVTNVVSVNPVLFAASALFALVTVLLSCRKPGRMAAKVSPVEPMRLQVLEVTRLRKGQAGARTSRKEKGKGYAAGFRGCVVRRFGLHVFLYSAQSGQYVEDHARRARRYSFHAGQTGEAHRHTPAA